MKLLITAAFFLMTACGSFVPNDVATKRTDANADYASPGNQSAVNLQTKKTPSVDDAEIKSRIAGKWLKEGAEDCYCGGCLDIQFDKQIDDFCVESNQIFVSANYQLDAANNRVNLFFKDTVELGAGGANLPWDKYDRKKPMATIDVSKSNQKFITVKWLGFSEKGKPESGGSEYGKWYAGRYYKQESQSGKNGAANAGKNFEAFLDVWRAAFKNRDKAALRELMAPDFSQYEIGDGADAFLKGIDSDETFNWKFFDRFSVQKPRAGEPSANRKPTKYISYQYCSASFELNEKDVWQWKDFSCGDD